jgi:hypothetical protein
MSRYRHKYFKYCSLSEENYVKQLELNNETEAIHSRISWNKY